MISDNLRGASYMTLAMAAFTLNDTCVKAVTTDMPLYQVMVLRGILTMIALAVIAASRGGLQLRFAPADTRLIGWRTAGEIGGTLAFLSALRHMPLANISAIMQFLPLAVTLGAALVLRERVGWRRMVAIGAGFFGVLLIVRPGTAGFDIWSVLGLVAVGCVVVRDLTTRNLSRSVPSISVAFLAATGVTLSGLVLLPLGGWVAIRPSSAVLIAAAAGALVIGYLFSVMAMRVGEVDMIAPFRYTALIFAIVLGWVSFGDLPDRLTLIGAAIVVATGIYAFYRERRQGQKLTANEKTPLRFR